MSLDKIRKSIFGAGLTSLYQAGNQILALAAAFLVVRTLVPADYAIYSIAVAVIGVVGSLCDAGVSSSLSSTLGKVWHDVARLACAVKTAIDFRRTFFLVFLPAIIGLFLWMSWGKTSIGVQVTLSCVIAATAYLSLASALLAIVPLFTGKQAGGQLAVLAGNAARIGLLGLASFATWNKTFLYLVAGGVAAYVTYALLKRIVPFTEIKRAQRDRAVQAEMLAVAKRLMPNAIFYSIQGQITIFLTATLGQSQTIAEVAALGRVAIAYAFLSSIFAIYGPPRFAMISDPASLRVSFLKILALFTLPVVAGSAFLTVFPAAFLIFLGPQYEHLSEGLAIMVWTSAILAIAGAIWAMLAARALVSLAWIYIPVIIVVQGVTLTFIDVSLLPGVLLFGLITALANLALNLFQVWRLVFR